MAQQVPLNQIPTLDVHGIQNLMLQRDQAMEDLGKAQVQAAADKATIQNLTTQLKAAQAASNAVLSHPDVLLAKKAASDAAVARLEAELKAAQANAAALVLNPPPVTVSAGPS